MRQLYSILIFSLIFSFTEVPKSQADPWFKSIFRSVTSLNNKSENKKPNLKTNKALSNSQLNSKNQISSNKNSTKPVSTEKTNSYDFEDHKITLSHQKKEKLLYSQKKIETLKNFPFLGENTYCNQKKILSDDFIAIENNGEHKYSVQDLFPEDCNKFYECKINSEEFAYLHIFCDEGSEDIYADGFIHYKGQNYFTGTFKKDLSNKSKNKEASLFFLDDVPKSTNCGGNPDKDNEKISKESLIKKIKKQFLPEAFAQSLTKSPEKNQVLIAPIIIDTDHELWNLFSSTIPSVGNNQAEVFFRNFAVALKMIRSIANYVGAASVLYTHEHSLKFELTQVFFYSNENDPWELEIGNTIEDLDRNGNIIERDIHGGDITAEYRRYWINNNARQNLSRALTHFISGKSFRARGYLGRKKFMGNDGLLDGVETPQDEYGITWHYRGGLCDKEYGFASTSAISKLELPLVELPDHILEEITSDIDEYFAPHADYIFNNRLVNNLHTFVHEVGHNLSSPHTRCYNPPIDRCGRAEDLGGCSENIGNENDQNRVSTLMSYCPQQDHRFHPSVKNQQELAMAWSLEQENCPLRIDENSRPNLNSNVTARDTRVDQVTRFSALSNDNDDNPIWHFWDFGDGSPIRSLQCENWNRCEVQHQYQRGGYYNIKVAATDERGGIDVENKEIRISRRNNSPPEMMPLIFTNGAIRAGQRINFEVSNIRDADLDSLRVTWHTSQNNRVKVQTLPLAEENFLALSARTSYRFFTSGEYTIRAVLDDGTDQVEASIEIEIPNVPPEIRNIFPSQRGNTYTFYTWIFDENLDYNSMTYEWHFSSGNPRVIESNQSAIQHSFSANDENPSMRLIVNDGHGGEDEFELNL